MVRRKKIKALKENLPMVSRSNQIERTNYITMLSGNSQLSPYCASEVPLVSQDEGVVLGVPVWECWAASWANACAVLYCSRNWDPVVPVFAPFESPTSTKPLFSMLTCFVGTFWYTIITKMQIMALHCDPIYHQMRDYRSLENPSSWCVYKWVSPCHAGCKGCLRMFGRVARLA